MSIEEIVEQLLAIPSLIALEALWDGDTQGWFIDLQGISRAGDGSLVEHRIGTLSLGGDIRLFNGEVPPWPEAEMAKEIFRRIAAQRSVELWFPSPDHPEDMCPSLRDRERATPCASCGIPLLQRDPCPWKGICYHCYRERERSTKT
jgi:hypothetical protein